jgi:hypothetical protein
LQFDADRNYVGDYRKAWGEEYYIVKGSSDTTFMPNANTTRAEFVSMLVRMFNLGKTTDAVPFNDVQGGAWYAADVAAAYKAGLVSGTADSFMPNREISREEMAVLALRAYEYALGKAASGASAASALKDLGNVSPWAADAVNKALAVGLMKGDAQQQFKPKQQATRAEAVQLLYNLLRLQG